MRASIVWELFKINLLYSNGNLLAQIKRKQAKKHTFSAFKSMLMRHLFSMLLVGGLYSIFFLYFSYDRSAGFFSVQLAHFAGLSLLYAFSGFFSIFYDSKDTALYLPLPVTSREVFLGKLLAAQSMLLPFLLPCLTLFSIAYWQIAGPLGLLFVLPAFFVLWLMLNVVSLLLLHLIGALLIKSPYKTLVATSLTGLSSLLGFISITYLQSSQTISLEQGGIVTMPGIPGFIGFHYLLSRPFSLDALLHGILPLLMVVGLLILCYHRIMPAYFQQVTQLKASKATAPSRPIRTVSRSLATTLVRHHLSTLKDSQLIIQTYVQSFLFLLILTPQIMKGNISNLLSSLEWTYYGHALLIGAFFGSMATSTTGFIGVALSLERKNYTFLKSLPLSFAGFVRQKFWVIFGIQCLPALVVYSIFLINLGLSPLLTACFVAGFGLISCLLSQTYYRRDHRLLLLDWQHTSQLFGRGMSQWLIAFLYLVHTLFSMVIIGLTFYLTNSLSPLVLSDILLLSLVILASLWQFILYRSYWKRLDNFF